MDFSDMFDKAKDGFDIVCKKTEDVVNTSKLKIEQASIEAKLSKDYEKLGRLYYEALTNGNGQIEEDTDKLIADIGTKINSIEELGDKIGEVKNKKLCPTCKKYVDINATFCSNCGGKF